MGFLDRFRPKWKHSDPEVRLRAVRELDATDDRVLGEVIRGDSDEHIRRVAIKRLENPRLLLDLGKALPDTLRAVAEDRANELLVARAVSDRGDAPLAALQLLTAPADLAQVAKRAARVEVRRAAVERLTDGKLLADLAVNADDDELRDTALARVKEPAALADVALRAEEKRLALAALARIHDPTVLAHIARDARNKAARAAAKERLPAPPQAATAPGETPRAAAPKIAPKEDKVRRAQQLALCMAAENAARADAPDHAIEALRDQWRQLDGEVAKPPMRDRFNAAIALHAKRKQQHEDEVKRAAAAKLAKEAAAAKHAKDAAAAKLAEEKAEADKNAMAERMARDRAAQQERAAAQAAAELAAQPTPEELEAAAARKREADERHAAKRAEFLAALEGAAVLIETAVAKGNRQAIDRALKDARRVSIDERALKPAPDADALRQRLASAREQAAAKIAEIVEAESWKRWAGLPSLEQIVQEAEALAEVIATVEDKRRVPAVMTELRERWKKAAGAPSDRRNALWERFKKAGDVVHEASKEFFAKQLEESAEAAARKEALCVAVEALVESTEWKETTEKIVALQGEWKTAGHVPGEKGEALWTRFRAACDKFFARRNEMDKSSDAEREQHAARAEEICAEVERWSTSTNWRQAGDTIKAFQEEWKQIGELPRGKGGALWKRFRAACDAFFAARKAAYDEEDAARVENLARKTALCERAEALAGAEDHHAAMNEAKALQAEWKQVGFVPREQQDAIWARFRAACDVVFDAARGAHDAGKDDDEDAIEAAPAGEPGAPPPSGVSGFVNRIPLHKILDKLGGSDQGGYGSDEPERRK